MKLKLIFLALCLPLFCIQKLQASVTIQFEFEALRDASGNPLTTSTYAIFIADSNKDSVFPSATDFFGSSLTSGSNVGNDRIFYSGFISSGGNLSGSASSLSGNDLGLNSDDEISGTRWALYWFPGLSAAPGEGGLQAGQSFGFYHNDTIDSYTQSQFEADAAMVMPNNGSTVKVLYLDTTVEPTSFPSVSDFSATFTVIPEPSALVLTLLGSLALLRRRRA